MRTKLIPLLLALSVAIGPQDPVAAPAAQAQVGKPAPAFRLNDHDGRLVAVGGKAEHWTVLAFYPKAATPG